MWMQASWCCSFLRLLYYQLQWLNVSTSRILMNSGVPNVRVFCICYTTNILNIFSEIFWLSIDLYKMNSCWSSHISSCIWGRKIILIYKFLISHYIWLKTFVLDVFRGSIGLMLNFLFWFCFDSLPAIVV